MTCFYPNLESSNLEEEYIQMRRLLYEKFFKYTMLAFLAAITIELLRSIINTNLSSLIGMCLFMTFGFLFTQFICKVKKNQEFNITIFFLIFYLVGLVIHYYHSDYFDNPSNSFYYGYVSATFESLIMSRMPKSLYRTIFKVSTALIRALIVRFQDNGILLTQFLILFYDVYLDLDKEKHDKNLFDTYYRSKEQLIKFKTLVEQDIPEGIMIVSSDLEEWLFINDSAKQLFGTAEKLKIQNQLSQFYIQDTLPSFNVKKDAKLSDISNKTLLSLLEENLSSSKGGFTNKKISCHLDFSKSKNIKKYDQQYHEQRKIFEASVMDIFWDEKSAIVIILHDITQEAMILELQREADENKDKILATVSHELRTPLNGILGMVHLMLKQIKDQEFVQYLNVCKNSGNLLLGLVNSILDLNQIRAGKFKLYPERVHIQSLLKEILNMFEFQCIQKKLFLTLNLSPKVPKFILTDKNRLSQIFINLLGNALKFTSKGGITISVSQSNIPDFIEFTVEDTGLGIKEEDKKKLFHMFGKLEQENKQINKQGIGLGLTISENLVRVLCDCSGSEGIKVESQYGQGSKFSFLIKKELNKFSNGTNNWDSQDSQTNISASFSDETKKLDSKIKNYETLAVNNFAKLHSKKNNNIDELDSLEEDKNKIFKKSLKSDKNSVEFCKRLHSYPLPESTKFDGFTQTILIVDDNPYNITVATYLLLSYIKNIKSAFSGNEAIDFLLKHDHITQPVLFILMDCQMPILNGYETTKILKEMMNKQKVPNIPIIALTANDSENDKEFCKKVGMCDHLTKPLNESNLIRIFKKYCEKPR